MKQKYDQLLDHNYDGIQEYDNPLPKWWLWLFYGTIIFGIFYLGYYHLLGGPGMAEEYAEEVAIAEQQFQAPPAPEPTPPGTPQAAASAPAAAQVDPDAGKKVFMTYCASCHGQLGEGGIGPNFADEYWIHGNSTEDIARVITQGVPEKGMMAWKSILNAKKIANVTAYILTLQGTNPPNAKAPSRRETPMRAH